MDSAAQAPQDPKQILAELIDAFASAKTTNNETLQRLVLGQIQQFFSTHDVIPVSPQGDPSIGD